MSIDVSYQGLTIARDAALRLEGPGIYVEMDGPMPVGTRLLLSHEDHRMEGRVTRVNEGVGPGMTLVPGDGAAVPGWITRIKPPAVQTVEIEAEPEVDQTLGQAPGQAAGAAPETSTQAASSPAASVAPHGPVAAQADSAPAAAQPVAERAEEPGPAVAGVSAGPPNEATQEMAIPSLDDEPRSDADIEAPREADKRSAKKKKPGSRRR